MSGEDIPGKARACLEERRERGALSELIGAQAGDIKATREAVQDLRKEIGEEPRIMSTDPDEKAGHGLKAILYNMRVEQNAKLEQLSKDVGEIKQQLPAAMTKRLRDRIISWGAVAGAVIALTTLVVGCYSIAKSVSALSHSVQVVGVK